MFGLGPWEILLILLVIAVIFGASRLPDIGSNLGKGIRNFKKSFQEINEETSETRKRATRNLTEGEESDK